MKKNVLSFLLVMLIASISKPATAAKLEEVYPVSLDCLAIEFILGSKIPGKLVPYKKQSGDEIKRSTSSKNAYQKVLVRDGKQIGYIAGPKEDNLYISPEFIPDQVQEKILGDPNIFTIQSSNDPNYKTPVNPKSLRRKTKPIDVIQPPNWQVRFIKRSTVFLELPSPLKEGDKYVISFGKELGCKPFEFTFESKKMETKAIQVTYVGFHPEDKVKFGILATWDGNQGIKYSPGMKFELLDANSLESCYRGKVKIAKKRNELDDPTNKWGQDRRVNISKADAWRLDFSNFKKSGKYVLHIPGIGVSHPFRIAKDVYKQTFNTCFKGFYNQRVGNELKKPYTDYERPLMFHPDMGKTAFHSKLQATPSVYDPNYKSGQSQAFGELERLATTKEEKNIWGGYADAGDYDRRPPHLIITRQLLELYELFPEKLGGDNLNIPESGNGMPDLIDEARWGIDLFTRLQQVDGGIPSWIESKAHPRPGEPSWLNSLQLFVAAPDMWTSHIYAATAARLALVLKPLDAKLSKEYYSSALKAWDWAEKRWPEVKDNPKLFKRCLDARNLAALEFYRFTGDEKYHKIFKETSGFKNPKYSLFAWGRKKDGGSADQSEAAFLYARMPPEKTDPELRNNILQEYRRYADWSVNFGKNTAHGWTKDHDTANIGWGSMGFPQTKQVIRQYLLTKEPKYLNATVRSTFFSYGMNGDHLSFTTGIGKYPRYPLLHDADIMNVPPPPGITLYGPWDPARFNYWSIKFINQRQAMTPAYNEWPVSESYLDMGRMLAGQCEFTVQQTMSPNTYIMGILAGVITQQKPE